MENKYIKESFNFKLRNEYVSSLEKYVDDVLDKSEKTRWNYTVNTSALKRRNDLKKMLGYPLFGETNKEITLLKEEVLENRNGVLISRMSFDIMGIKTYGLLLKPLFKKMGMAFAIFQHGGDGIPEEASSMLDSSFNYNDGIKKLSEKGVVVFVPQMLLWKSEKFASPYNREIIDKYLIQAGGCSKSLELFLTERYIDYFSKQSYVNSRKMGYVGLSWGGMFALYAGALDTRLKVVYSSCYFNDRRKYPCDFWVHSNMANKFFDSEIATLILPRALLIECGKNDFLFNIEGAKSERKRLENYVEFFNFNKDNLVFNFFDGDHEFSSNEKYLNWFVDKLENM